MGCRQSGRLRLISALLTAILLFAACAGSADDRDERGDDVAGTVDDRELVSEEAEPAPVASGSEAPDTPERPGRDRPPLAGGYAQADVDAQIVAESAEVVQAALGGGLTAILAAVEAGTIELSDSSALAECKDLSIELREVTAAATQVVAGTNVWLAGDYACGQIVGTLSAIVYWSLQREGRLTDLDLAFADDDFNPLDQ